MYADFKVTVTFVINSYTEHGSEYHAKQAASRVIECSELAELDAKVIKIERLKEK